MRGHFDYAGAEHASAEVALVQLFIQDDLVGVLEFRQGEFGRQELETDRAVGESGLPGGAQQGLYHFARDVKLFGHENVPAEGPALFLSNHPGMIDTLSLFAAIARRDLRIIALDRPFRGDLGLRPDAYQLMFDQLMKPVISIQ